MPAMIYSVLFSSLILHPSSLAWADGGTVRLSEQKGNYRIAVFTSPTPVRAGPVDVSVLVQDAATGKLASGVQVTIKAVRRDSAGVAFHGPATTEAATNKLYDAAVFELPEPGWYSVEVSVDGDLGKVEVGFEVEAAEPLPALGRLAGPGDRRLWHSPTPGPTEVPLRGCNVMASGAA
jgi:hypothetical protein